VRRAGEDDYEMMIAGSTEEGREELRTTEEG